MPWHIQEREGRYCVIKDADGSTEKCHDTKEQATRHMAALYANTEGENRRGFGPTEHRAATVERLDFKERIIEVLAAPYNQEAIVEYRGELYLESFERGAFDGINTRPEEKKVKAYRDHAPGAHMRGTNTSGLIGKVISFSPDRPEGLIGQVKISETPLGNETLQLAKDGVLGVSIGFGVRGRDQVLNRSEQPFRRRIKRAFVDHLAFPDNGAYEGAQVLDVRGRPPQAEDLPKLETPRLDEIVAWMEQRRLRSDY